MLEKRKNSLLCILRQSLCECCGDIEVVGSFYYFCVHGEETCRIFMRGVLCMIFVQGNLEGVLFEDRSEEGYFFLVWYAIFVDLFAMRYGCV